MNCWVSSRVVGVSPGVAGNPPPGYSLLRACVAFACTWVVRCVQLHNAWHWLARELGGRLSSGFPGSVTLRWAVWLASRGSVGWLLGGLPGRGLLRWAVWLAPLTADLMCRQGALPML